MAKMSFAQKIKNLFAGKKSSDEDFFDDLADALIEGDVGAALAMQIVDSLCEVCRKEKISSEDEILKKLKGLLLPYVKSCSLAVEPCKNNIWMLLGVNGVGKTTTIGKLAHQFAEGGKKVLLCAGDTFRAAAAEQLNIWEIGRAHV